MQGGNLNRTLLSLEFQSEIFCPSTTYLREDRKAREPIGTASGQPLLCEEKFLLAKEKDLRVIQILGRFSISF